MTFRTSIPIYLTQTNYHLKANHMISSVLWALRVTKLLPLIFPHRPHLSNPEFIHYFIQYLPIKISILLSTKLDCGFVIAEVCYTITFQKVNIQFKAMIR